MTSGSFATDSAPTVEANAKLTVVVFFFNAEE
jgi:hypothetical protein